MPLFPPWIGEIDVDSRERAIGDAIAHEYRRVGTSNSRIGQRPPSQPAGDIEMKPPINLEAEEVMTGSLRGGGHEIATFAAADFEFEGTRVAKVRRKIERRRGLRSLTL